MKSIIESKYCLYAPLVIIMIISFFNMYNAQLLSSIYNNNLIKQIIWYLVGFGLIFILNKFNLRVLMKYSSIYYGVSILLLGMVLVMGNTVNGAKAWFNLGLFSFQPSELAKLSLVIHLSNVVANYQVNNIKDEVILIIRGGILTLIPSILVFLEPDTGAIIFFVIIYITMMYFSNIRRFWFIILGAIIAIGLILFSVFYLYNQDLLISLIGTSFFYRVERLITFASNSSYQLDNALIAVGSSSWYGTGLKKIAIYIPEAPTDFIFAFNISNFGILGGFVIIGCYYIMDIYLIRKLNIYRDKKIKLFLSSFINMFIIQQIVNIGMNIGLLPIMGIPLPFLSYGGSTIIIYFIFLGIIMNYDNHVY